MFNPEVLLRISKEVGAPVSRVETTLKLLEEGATVPFIARYRKEATGNLDEVKIRDIDEKRHYYKDLEDRRNTILASIEKQGQLTDELKARILASYSKNELEDLYLPYKPKRKTKASVALERGLIDRMSRSKAIQVVSSLTARSAPNANNPLVIAAAAE